MRFRKYHGIGNDFVMLEDLERRLGAAASLDRELVAALCDRHTGIGADGVIRIIGPRADPETAQAGAVLRMDYYNADGGPAEMCGNGIRCLAILAHKAGWLAPGTHGVLTGGGLRTIVLEGDGVMVSVDMGEPAIDEPPLRLETGEGTHVEGTHLSMGNPHFVIFVPEPAIPDELVQTLGPLLEHHPAFPDRTNVEFVHVVSPGEISIRVWERGVGETQACGSGACAGAAAAAALGMTKRELDVRLPGGTLRVVWGEDGHVWMTGPAEEVFAGEIDEGWLAERGPR